MAIKASRIAFLTFSLFAAITLFGCEKQESQKADTSQAITSRAMPCERVTSTKDLNGVWSNEKFITALKNTRSWSDAVRASRPELTSIKIENGRFFFTASWQESWDTDDSNDFLCLSKDRKKIWYGERNWTKFDGPFIKIGSGESEDNLYLAQFWQGCYKSNVSEKWCFTKDGISIDGISQPARLAKSMPETPDYGTIFFIDGLDQPFMIFVPQNNGNWLVYLDDWATSESYIPIKIGESEPWRKLTKVK